MYRGLSTEIERLVLFMGFCALIGWLTGYLTWSLMIGASLYGLFLLRQMQRFYVWLSRNDSSEPPQSSGIWGDIFDAIYRMRKVQAQQQASLRAQLTRLHDSMASLKDGMMVLDNRGQLEDWNDAAGHLLGLRRQADEHQMLTNLFRDPRFVQYFQQGDYQETLVVASPTNGLTQLEIQINVFGDNEKLMLVRDVTRLQQLEKIRSDFVANVSHELRTPLTVLKGYLEAFEDQRDQLNPRWQKALEHMQQQTLRMQNLVNDLTLLSGLENRHADTRKQPVAVHELAARICEDGRRLSTGHQIELQGDELYLFGNENALHSAFANLLNNALRYATPDTTIHVRWGKDLNGAFFSVRDEGPGIPAAHLPRLTERFYRVDAGRSRNDGGTGLGLAIVKHALARHNAELQIRSVVGEGSTFTCRFPASAML